MKSITLTAGRAPSSSSTWSFVRHFLEMVAAMIVGMMVLGGLAQLIFAILGHGSVLHYAGLRALLMTINMVIGMSLWMRHRHHSWMSIGEMSGAMFVPFAVLIIPYGVGVLSAGAFFAVLHVLMLPCMLIVMLRRPSEYTQDHGRHSSGHSRLPSATSKV